MKKSRLLGLMALKRAAKVGECVFCGSPAVEKSRNPDAVRKRRKKDRSDFQYTCGADECRRVWSRYWRRDDRA